MSAANLQIKKKPKLTNPALVIGLTGWMDGGEVSTGTVRYMIDVLDAVEIAEINPKGFYLYNFPGPMELSSLFRPSTTIRNGLVRDLEWPRNTFYRVPEKNVILFSGKEPNMGWEDYMECVFSLCDQFGVRQIYFVGSVGGLAPHSREPAIHSSSANKDLRNELKRTGLKMSDYEGPSSIITCMMVQAEEKGIPMATLVAEIPVYVQGYNPRCIQATLRILGKLLNLPIRTTELQEASKAFDRKIHGLMETQPDLKEKVKELEKQHDQEAFDTEMGDLKAWLEEKGLRLD